MSIPTPVSAGREIVVVDGAVRGVEGVFPVLGLLPSARDDLGVGCCKTQEACVFIWLRLSPLLTAAMTEVPPWRARREDCTASSLQNSIM